MSDAFAQAVEDARQRLSQAEGRNITVGELARRPGINRRTLDYNLSPERSSDGRKIDPKLVRAVAAVLPINEAERSRAAHVAAGYQVRGDEIPDLGYEVARFLDRDDVDDEAKRELTARLAEIVAAEMRKATRERANGE
jgi:hypothetical protein